MKYKEPKSVGKKVILMTEGAYGWEPMMIFDDDQAAFDWMRWAWGEESEDFNVDTYLDPYWADKYNYSVSKADYHPTEKG